MNKTFQAIWLSLLIAIAVAELVSLFFPVAGTATLSGYTRIKTAHPAMKVALGGMLGWLQYHWLFTRNGSPLGALDAIAAAIGALLGLAAWMLLK